MASRRKDYTKELFPRGFLFSLCSVLGLESDQGMPAHSEFSERPLLGLRILG